MSGKVLPLFIGMFLASANQVALLLCLFLVVPFVLALVGRGDEDLRVMCGGLIVISVALGMFIVANHHGPYIASHPTAQELRRLDATYASDPFTVRLRLFAWLFVVLGGAALAVGMLRYAAARLGGRRSGRSRF